MTMLRDHWPYDDADPEPSVSLWEILGLGLVFAAIVVVTIAAVTILGVL